MATKTARIVAKKSSTALAVPSAASALTAELLLNIADRKFYSKDAAAIFQVAPSMAEHNLKAPISSPTFTDDPRAPTPATSDNSTKLATTAFVKAVINSLVDAAPGTLDTLNELAAALGDDPNFATTMANALAAKASAAQGALASSAVQPAEMTAAITAKFVSNVLGADGSRGTGYNPAVNGFGYYNNSTGSTGYPAVAGLTLSFMFGGDNGRAWDIWKGFGGAENWSVRTSMGDGTFGTWRRLIHDGLKATQGQAEAGADDATYLTPLKGGQEMDGRATKLFGTSSL